MGNNNGPLTYNLFPDITDVIINGVHIISYFTATDRCERCTFLPFLASDFLIDPLKEVSQIGQQAQRRDKEWPVLKLHHQEIHLEFPNFNGVFLHCFKHVTIKGKNKNRGAYE